MDQQIKDAEWKESAPPAAGAKEPEDFARLLAVPCEVRVVGRGGRYTLAISELGLLVTGKDLATAHAEIMLQRERCLREFAAEGVLDWLPRPGAAPAAGPEKKSLLGQLKPFLVKAAIATALFLGAVNVVSNGLGDVGYVLEKKLDGVASMTPEAVEKHRAKAAKIAEKLGPIVREILAVFDRSVAPGAAPRAEAADNATAKP